MCTVLSLNSALLFSNSIVDVASASKLHASPTHTGPSLLSHTLHPPSLTPRIYENSNPTTTSAIIVHLTLGACALRRVLACPPAMHHVLIPHVVFIKSMLGGSSQSMRASFLHPSHSSVLFTQQQLLFMRAYALHRLEVLHGAIARLDLDGGSRVPQRRGGGSGKQRDDRKA